MTTNPYPPEVLDEDDDNGTMPESLEALAKAIVGHRIISVDDNVPRGSHVYSDDLGGLRLTLDNGQQAILFGGGDCCAFTEVQSFLLNPEAVDHIITGVGTTDGYTTWHIYADLGDILTLKVGWSCGNPFYYGYGFDIEVIPVGAEVTRHD